jgi:hypothetical protein
MEGGLAGIFSRNRGASLITAQADCQSAKQQATSLRYRGLHLARVMNAGARVRPSECEMAVSVFMFSSFGFFPSLILLAAI